MLFFVIIILILVCSYYWGNDSNKNNILSIDIKDKTLHEITNIKEQKSLPAKKELKPKMDKEIPYSKYTKNNPILPRINQANKTTKYQCIESNVVSKSFSFEWKKEIGNTLVAISAPETPLCKISIKQDKDEVIIDKVSFFCIYDLQGNIYLENGIKAKNLPLKIDNNVNISLIEESWNNKILTPSILFFRGMDFNGNISWEDSSDSHLRMLTIHKEGYTDIILGVIDFYIYELDDTSGELKRIVYNGSLEKNVTTILENIYIIAKTPHPNGKYTETLYLYKGNILLHKIEEINPCFSLDKKITPNGGLLCQVFNKKEADYNDVSTLYLNPNGDVNYLCNKIPKYENINNYLEEFRYSKLNFKFIDSDGFINIYFYQKECLNFYLVNEYTQNADYKKILDNKFEDDATINYHVKYRTDRVADIAFVYFTLESRMGANLAFNNGLYGTKFKNNVIAGNAIYGFPFLDYLKGLDGDFAYLNTLSQVYLKEEQRANYKEFIKLIYSKYNEPVNYNNLPEDFFKNSISADIMLDKLENFIKSQSIDINYASKIIYDKNGDLILDYKTKKDELKQQLIKSGKYNTRWKSELELYNLIVKIFPNAVYQYHNKILGAQSFDIFIPNLNIAFEYQGEQHYKPIDMFGGIATFEKRKELDERKRNICKQNHIKLIEWKYTTPITQLNLELCLRELKIDI